MIAYGATMSDQARVLVIDDDRDIQEFCRALLEKQGYVVGLASSGEEGRAAMTSSGADLVILDVMMEQIDAEFETARWFSENHPGVPVILFSSIAATSVDVFDMRSLKVADIVNKPISPEAFLKKVSQLLKPKA